MSTKFIPFPCTVLFSRASPKPQRPRVRVPLHFSPTFIASASISSDTHARFRSRSRFSVRASIAVKENRNRFIRISLKRLSAAAGYRILALHSCICIQLGNIGIHIPWQAFRLRFSKEEGGRTGRAGWIPQLLFSSHLALRRAVFLAFAFAFASAFGSV